VPESLPYLLSGILLGLTSGLMPGPLNTVLITETVRHSRKQGIIVAFVPLITDLPIILVSIFILSRLTEFNAVLGIISLAGAVFLTYLAYRSITVKASVGGIVAEAPKSLRTGLITNFLSPNPYLFWMTVGAATVINGFRTDPLAVVFFLGSFYFCLVIVNIALAITVDRFRSFMGSRVYIFILRALGLMLLIYSVIYARDGLRMLGVI